MPFVVVLGLLTAPMHPNPSGYHASKPVAINRATQELERRVESVLLDLGTNKTAFIGLLAEPLHIIEPKRDRFLDDDIDAGAKQFQGMLGVVARFGQNTNDIWLGLDQIIDTLNGQGIQRIGQFVTFLPGLVGDGDHVGAAIPEVRSVADLTCRNSATS